MKKSIKKEIIVHENPKSPIAESFRTLRTNIQFTQADNTLKTILVTSGMPGEGKSWVSSNLAITFAQSNKQVLIIDADMRKGRQYELFNVNAKNGLSNWLSGIDEYGNANTKPISEHIQSTDIENLFVMSSGITAPNPSELLSSEKMTETMKILKNMFDIIIIDGTPCMLVSDSVILSRIVDTTIVVVSYNQTKTETLQYIKKFIQNVGGKIGGVIMNKVPASSKPYGGGYYYYGSNTGNKKKMDNLYENEKMNMGPKTIYRENVNLKEDVPETKMRAEDIVIPEIKPEIIPEAKVEVQFTPGFEPELELEPEIEEIPEPEPEPKVEVAAEPELELEVEEVPELELEPEVEEVPELELESEIELSLEPEQESKIEPISSDDMAFGVDLFDAFGNPEVEEAPIKKTRASKNKKIEDEEEEIEELDGIEAELEQDGVAKKRDKKMQEEEREAAQEKERIERELEKAKEEAESAKQAKKEAKVKEKLEKLEKQKIAEEQAIKEAEEMQRRAEEEERRIRELKKIKEAQVAAAKEAKKAAKETKEVKVKEKAEKASPAKPTKGKKDKIDRLLDKYNL